MWRFLRLGVDIAERSQIPTLRASANYRKMISGRKKQKNSASAELGFDAKLQKQCSFGYIARCLHTKHWV